VSAVAKSVSIIVPTRNEAENIAALISGIMAQPLPLQEILFVDDNSTDETRNLIRSHSATHPIRLIEQDSGGGNHGRRKNGAE